MGVENTQGDGTGTYQQTVPIQRGKTCLFTMIEQIFNNYQTVRAVIGPVSHGFP